MNYKFRKLLLYFSCGLIAGGVLFYITWSFYEHRNYKQQLHQNVIYWKSIIGRQPNYPDGWVKLAVNWHKLGKDNFAQLAIEKAEKLDPISDEIISLKEKLLNPKHEGR